MTYNPDWGTGGGISDGDKGDITVTASGATWTVDNGVIGTAKLGGDITTAGKALLDDADNAAQRTTLGLGTLATQNGTFSGTSSGTNTGDQTSVSGNAGTATALQTGRTIAITGDLAYTSPTFDGTGNVTATGTIQSGAVTLGKMSALAGNSLIGNNTGSPTTPVALTTTQVKTLLAIAAGDVSGLGTLATQSGTFSGTSSGTNTGDQTITLTGDVTGTGTGSFAATIANDAVTYAKMQNASAASVLLGRGSAGGAGNLEEVTLGANLTLTGTVLSASSGTGANTLYAPGSFTVATGNFALHCKRLQLTTTQRMTLAGTARFRLSN